MRSNKVKSIDVLNSWAIGNCPTVLEQIQQDHVNIVIYERDVDCLTSEILPLLDKNIELSASGDTDSIVNKLKFDLAYQKLGLQNLNMLIKDIELLLLHFKKISKCQSFRLLLATIDTDMCRRFHTDSNDLRMLCTYSGPGTLWLAEDNVNRQALNSCGANDCIVLDESKIQQTSTSSVVILKGSTYSNSGSKAAVHRSPDIKKLGEKRLLLRIDTNNT